MQNSNQLINKLANLINRHEYEKYWEIIPKVSTNWFSEYQIMIFMVRNFCMMNIFY